MVFKHFRWNVVWRTALILLLGYTSMYIVLNTHFWLVGLWTIGFTVVMVVNLIRYVETSNREMANFLMAVKQGDFTNTYTPGTKGKSMDELRAAIADIVKVFQRLSTEKETHYLFLQTVVEHVSTALLTFDENGEVINMNKAAQNLFQRPHIRNIQRLQAIDSGLLETVSHLDPGKPALIKFTRGDQLMNLSIRAAQFTLKQHEYRLVSFQDIASELQDNEAESWQKLIRVLTHEIMNSAIPISTLTNVISQILEDKEGNPVNVRELDEESIEDLKGGLKTIENRSKGLVKFVQAYKSLTNIGPPHFEKIEIGSLIDGVIVLLKPDLEKQGVSLELEIEENLTIQADAQLIEQILINLLKNALDAMSDSPQKRLEITGKVDNESTQVSVTDNGSGIAPEQLDQIFVPFYSTKKHGSGIGLSLSRQIMRLHRGTITASSTMGKGSTFKLNF